MTAQNESQPPAGPSGGPSPALPIDPPPPAFRCIVYYSVRDGSYCGRVANLDGIEATGSSQRGLLETIVRRFRAEVAGKVQAGVEPEWVDPPMPKRDDEKKLFLPVHL